MTLIDPLSSSPPTTTTIPNEQTNKKIFKVEEEEEEEETTNHHDQDGDQYYNDNYAIQLQPNQDGGLLQNLGSPNGGIDLLTSITNNGGNISVENSSDVHFGDKNIYQGPVTIKQIVYADGSSTRLNNSNSVIVNKEDDDEDVVDVSGSYCKDGVNIKTDKRFKDGGVTPNATKTVSENGGLSRMRKAIIRLEKYIKRKPLQITILLTVTVFILIIIITAVILHYLPNNQIVLDYNGPATIKPDDYDQHITDNQISNSKLRLVSRAEWVAQPPQSNKPTIELVPPVPYVVIHQTATENCSSRAQCVLHVRFLQSFDIESKGFSDIGYNFLVGGDGAVYEGRGWKIEGDRYYDYNTQSILIAFIGTFNRVKPSPILTVTCQKLIREGVELKYINKRYKLLVDKSVTKINDSALYNEVKLWPQWVNNV